MGYHTTMLMSYNGISIARKFKFYNYKSMFPSIIWSVNITFLYLHYFSLFYIKARLMHLYILRFVDPASLHKNEPHAQFVFSIFRRTCTCFGRNYSPSSGGTPYGYNSPYLLFFLVDCLLSWLGWDNNKTLFYNTYHKY